jgi:hypothetical protein
MRDGLMQRAVRNTHTDIMDHTSCVLFLNGQYWGVYEIRERQDKYYIQQNHGIDYNKMDLLRFEGDIMAGDNQTFFEMVDFIQNNTMSDQDNYDSVKNYLLDIENFTDYMAAETYYDNPDWIYPNSGGSNNIKFWRPNDPPGKFRYVLWDTDGGLGLFGNVTDNLLSDIIDTNQTQWSNHSIILYNLLMNQEFKTYFINRYADLINTTFHPNNLGKLATQIRDEMQPEMGRHFAMWANPNTNPYGFGSATNVSEWLDEFDTLMTFINVRPSYARNYIEAEFNLVQQVDVTLDVVPAGAGKIKISTIIPDSLPWTGVYFDGNPVGMTAIANPGYKFSYWQSPNLIPQTNSSPYINLNISQSESFTAYFVPMEYTFNAYPNPFTNSFTINFLLPEDQPVSIRLFNLLGERVAEIIQESMEYPWGEHTLTFDAAKESLAAGVYFLEFRTDEYRKVVKLIKSNQ